MIQTSKRLGLRIYAFLINAIGINVILLYCNSCNRLKYQQCNPSNKHLFSKFLIQQWLHAQRELGIDYFQHTKHIDGFFHSASQILSINSVSPGAHVFYSTTGHTVTYVIFWKCGSDGIIRNLIPLTTPSAKLASTHNSMNHFVRTQSEYESIVAAMNWGQNRSILQGSGEPIAGFGYTAPSMPPMFTFVRDPLQRFVAGFVESVLRTLNPVKQDSIPNFDPLGDLDRIPLQPLPRDLWRSRALLANDKTAAATNPPPPKSNVRLVNVSIVANYLYHFFSLDNRLVLPGHFYPMAGPLMHMNISILGHLEKFEEDWASISELLAGKAVSYNYDTGLHPTSANYPVDKVSARLRNRLKDRSTDPNNARVSLLRLFKEDVRYMRAVCQLLLVDYVCLPSYPLPTECSFLNDSRNAAMEALSRGVMIPAMRSSS